MVVKRVTLERDGKRINVLLRQMPHDIDAPKDEARS